MKIVSRAEYLEFLASLGAGVEEMIQDGEVVAVQSVDIQSQVRAQVLYFKHVDNPQYMIDVREVWAPGKKPPRSLEDTAAG